MWVVSGQKLDVTVMVWWLQVNDGGGVRTERGLLQLLCGGYR